MGGTQGPGTPVNQPGWEFLAFATRSGLAAPGERGQWWPVSGGVSSDIWHVSLRSGEYCVKRALAQLKVADEWKAPVERNATEWAYFEVVSGLVPGAVPKPVAHDPEGGLFAMEWLPSDRYRLWKTELLSGRVDVEFARSVGQLLGRIHAATANDPILAQRFATDSAFHALRMEPYLLTAGRRHPAVEPGISRIANRTAGTRRVLVHGDASPKNILVGPGSPVLLDAEVAWYGDPAFDLAFCLNHLVVKRRVVAGVAGELDLAFDALCDSYLSRVTWESPLEVERRAADLLPALALARVDGKSPLEYLSEVQRGDLRSVALHALFKRPADLKQARDMLVA